MSSIYSGAALGAYGRQAGAVIEFEWVPDPLVFSEKILHIRDQLEDRTVPLAISKGILARDVEQNFEGEHDPEGQPWEPWSSAYHPEGHPLAGQRKLGYMEPTTGKQSSAKLGYAENLPPGHSGMILNWRGHLKEAATSEASYMQVSGQSVNDDSLFFDTGGLPPYWVYHEQPTSPNTGLIPQRSFLGMSGEAELQVMEAFETWFMGILAEAATAPIVEAATSSRGRTFARYRDPVTKRFAKNPNA